MKKEHLKIGMSCDVITITVEQPRFDSIMKKGNKGIVTIQYDDGDVLSCIGIGCKWGLSTLLVPKGEFKMVGRLTITKLK